MKCKEAQELFGVMPELSENDPKRKMLESHLASCEYCAAEYKIWNLSMEAVLAIPPEVTEFQAEQVNRRVMDRIYAESPWLAPDIRDKAHSKRLRRRSTVWAACFMALFLVSSILFVLGGTFKQEQQQSQQMTGILPAVVLSADDGISSDFSFNVPEVSRGIVEPFVVQLGPAYPQYWMLLSSAGMVLAFISWKGLRRYRS